MLYEIFFPLIEKFTAFNLIRYISFRAVFAAVTAFLVCVVIGPGIIRLLTAHKLKERVCCGSLEMDEIRRMKGLTPTMGGTIILLAIVVSVLLFGRLDNLYVVLGLWTIVAFGLIGAADDWVKLTKPGRGMKSMTKLKLQLVAGLIVVVVLWLHVRERPGLTQFQIPLVKGSFDLGLLYIPVGLLVIVGASNGVNFTDGMDGLAIGGVTMTGLTFLAITYVVGRVDMSGYLYVAYVPGAGELTVFLGAVVVAGLGFLWFNCYPAQVFMGDAGSLSLGAALGFVAFVARQEAVLFVAGLVFVADGISVILQVGSYRLFGRKILPFAPISNWWLLRSRGGEPRLHEVKVTVRYWIVMAIMGAISLMLLKVR